MPIPATIGDCYQLKIVGSIEGQQTNNILHFRSATGDTDVELHLVLVVVACFVEHLLPGLAAGWKLTEVAYKRVSPTLGPESIYLVPAEPEGEVLTDALPSLVSAVISIRTALGGRSGRGRMYLAGLPEDNVIGSKITVESVTWTALVAFCACIAGAFTPNAGTPGPNTWFMQVYSRKIGGAVFPFGASGFNNVTALVPTNFIGTTRSRKVGRGS